MLQCGTTNEQLKIELLSRWKLEAEFRNIHQYPQIQRFGSGNMDGFNMIGLLLPGVAVTYNGEEIGENNSLW